MIATAAIALQRGRAGKGRPRDVEGPIHRSITRYLRATLPHAWLVVHAANKPRSMQQGAREKAMGALAGWPDLQILGPGPDGPSCWFLEDKAPGGKVSAAQKDLHDQIMDAGFAIRVVRSVDDARDAVRDWALPSTDALIKRRKS